MQRLRPALFASLTHLAGSFLVALACAALVFLLWYPYPYGELVGGRELFLLVVSVDVVCGPLLTLIVFNPSKPRQELWRDIGIVVLLQLGALGYGIGSVIQARPVFLAFEGDRFRVVSVPDIDLGDIDRAPASLQKLSLTGPRVLGVRLATGSEPDYRQSISLALEGLHPAFRPSRWVEYDTQREFVRAELKPLTQLAMRYPSQRPLFDEAVNRAGTGLGKLGYLPLIAGSHSDWVVIVSLDDGQPKGFLPLDGW
ncbi:MAG: pilus assembly protein [Candidatus Competibacter sp.]|nr:pilus assembly protein [Candidatus Competibacter sp.]